MALNILIIDDEPGITALLQALVERAGHTSNAVNDPREVEAQLNSALDLIFLDLNMPHLDGVQVLRLLADKKITAFLVLMSGYDHSVLNTAHELAEAHGLNVFSHINKPFKADEIARILNTVAQSEVKIKPHRTQKIQPPQIAESELRSALKENRIEMHYQPQMDMKMQRILGIESLCRIRTPKNELIYPEAFIPIAEKLGVIHELTLQVVRKVAQECSELLSKYHGMTVSINISTHDLEHLDFPEVLESIFSEYDIEPTVVIVEVTESLLVHELRIGLDILARMRLKGFKVSIDDFGKGASALEHLKHFPATELKIDKEFIQSIHDSDKSYLLVRHTLDLAHQLGLDVVAEGVEDQATADWLVAAGCDIIQGFWLSEPLPQLELIEFLGPALTEPEGDSMFTDGNETVPSPEIKVNHSLDNYADAADKNNQNNVLISAILPLTGGFSFVGNSQLYGIKAALKEFDVEKKVSDIKVNLEVFDDQSDMNKFIKLSKTNVSPNAIACLGGVFNMGNTGRFISAVLAMKRAVIGPFSGSILLRNKQWKNLFNVRPSYEDELHAIVHKIRLSEGKTVLIYPDNAFGKRAGVILDKLIKVEHITSNPENRTNKYLIREINKSNAQHIIFIGTSKTMVELIKEVTLTAATFYTISLVGLGSLIQSLKNSQTKVSVTTPVDDYQANTLAANQFRKYLSPLLDEASMKYMNSISFEAYINARIFLIALQKSESCTKAGLIRSLEGLVGVDIGLPHPVSWMPEKRQFFHDVKLLEGRVGR